MKRKHDLLVVGELNVDLILSGDAEPEFNQVEKLISDATLTLGSSSAIFACAAAKLGLKVAFAGKIGKDLFGEYILEQLRSHAIDVQGVHSEEGIKTGITIIFNRGSDRAILTYPGSIATLNYRDIDQKLMRECRHLHLGGYYLLDDLRADVPGLFSAARQAGLTTSLDTNFDPTEKWGEEIWKVLEHTNIFLPNRTEICSIAREHDLSLALNKVAGVVPVVAVKLGGQGALARKKDQEIKADSLPVKVVDTVGAGDTFDAGFVYAFLNQWDIERSLKFACVCGSLSTQRAGGIAGQPTLPEALQWL